MTAFTVAGVPVEVLPTGRVTDLESVSLSGFAENESAHTRDDLEPFLLHLEERTSEHGTQPDGNGPALVTADNGLIRVRHSAFEAEIDPIRGCGRLQRDPRSEFPLRVTLRVAVCSRLPLVSRVPLHAAGVVVNNNGLVFFGPSGAGKTTLSRLSPKPVLSDELVVAGASPPELSNAGFFASSPTTTRRHHLRALIELDKGAQFSMIRLGSQEAFRRLLSVTMIPASSVLWNASMRVISDLIHEVPVYRMAWTPSKPPWELIASELDIADTRPIVADPTRHMKGLRH